MDKLYTTNGWAGDEDNGEMASWYILSALGVYSLEGQGLKLNTNPAKIALSNKKEGTYKPRTYRVWEVLEDQYTRR